MEFFETDSVRLSMRSPETGRYLKANVYTLAGVENEDGSLREMSIGQLVMAVCLSRATELERKIVALMDDMAINTDNLDALSRIEEWLVGGKSDTAAWTEETVYDASFGKLPDGEKVVFHEQDAAGNIRETITTDNINDVFARIGVTYDGVKTTVGDVIGALEEKIDAFNTVSQEQLIEMQSLTSKRDDTYSLVSNVLKSLYTVLTGNANNL